MLKAAEGDALPSIDVDEGKWKPWPMGGIDPRHEWVRQIRSQFQVDVNIRYG